MCESKQPKAKISPNFSMPPIWNGLTDSYSVEFDWNHAVSWLPDWLSSDLRLSRTDLRSSCPPYFQEAPDLSSASIMSYHWYISAITTKVWTLPADGPVLSYTSNWRLDQSELPSWLCPNVVHYSRVILRYLSIEIPLKWAVERWGDTFS